MFNQLHPIIICIANESNLSYIPLIANLELVLYIMHIIF
jgi:hypothetical protein